VTGALLHVNELFDSLQGEGASVGAPCTFLRLAGCNLSCTWCDTPYTWDWVHHDKHTEVHSRPVADLAAELSAPQGGRLVVTGGEPLLQAPALEALFAQLPVELAIEVETNGTLAPSPTLVERVTQWNVSPKLGSAGQAPELAWKHDVLRGFAANTRAWLKLVVAPGAADEAARAVEALGWPRERVIFMPEARTREELRERSPALAEAARDARVRFGTRLHLELWGSRRGV
jgi:7-carboxy-7-deazaguanine synthase